MFVLCWHVLVMIVWTGRALDVDSLLLLMLFLLLLPGATATTVLRATGRCVVYATSTHMTLELFFYRSTMSVNGGRRGVLYITLVLQQHCATLID